MLFNRSSMPNSHATRPRDIGIWITTEWQGMMMDESALRKLYKLTFHKEVKIN
jgi:hypothetical protein